MAGYGYQHYKEQSVKSMTPGELLNLLWDELLKRLTRAEMALDNAEYNLFDTSIKRAVEIINYFIDTLNYNYEISMELKSMYDFFLYEFSRIQAGRSVDVIQEVKPLVREMSETFKEAQRLSGK